MLYTESDWQMVAQEAKEELACAYANGDIDIPQPVDANLNKLANRIVKRVVLSIPVAS